MLTQRGKKKIKNERVKSEEEKERKEKRNGSKSFRIGWSFRILILSPQKYITQAL